jgi:hypothetical protein
MVDKRRVEYTHERAPENHTENDIPGHPRKTGNTGQPLSEDGDSEDDSQKKQGIHNVEKTS